MINLDERYHDYLTNKKTLRIDGAEEQVVGVGPKATFERLWLKHKRGDKAGK